MKRSVPAPPAALLLSSPVVTTALLCIMAVLTVYGTIYQVRHGVFEAQEKVFNAWVVFIAGFLPFPGVKLAVCLLFLNLSAAGIVRVKRSWRKIGLLFVHTGIAVLFINAGLGYFVRQESVLSIREGESSASATATEAGGEIHAVPLPLRIHLDTFVIKRQIGSNVVSDFESRLHVVGESIDRDIVISMNRPFRFGDFTFYQSSYRFDGDRAITSLSVVRNPFRLLPYIASIMIAVGLIIHFLIMLALNLWRKNDP